MCSKYVFDMGRRFSKSHEALNDEYSPAGLHRTGLGMMDVRREAQSILLANTHTHTPTYGNGRQWQKREKKKFPSQQKIKWTRQEQALVVNLRAVINGEAELLPLGQFRLLHLPPPTLGSATGRFLSVVGVDLSYE